MKPGALDFLTRPISIEQIKHLLFRVNLLEPSDDPIFKSNQPEIQPLDGLIGHSEVMCNLRDILGKAARSSAAIYLSGESGTGKELAALMVHKMSGRKGLFVPVNCGAIPENLMESEFFGYKKGSFTGAHVDHEGFFQVAQGGTIFLDEVADLPLLMQVKLLRAIQEKKIRRLGSSTEEPVDVRVISASHKTLEDLVENGGFRQDLYYRLKVIGVDMPSLRMHPEDIPEIVAYLLKQRMGSEQKISLEAMRRLCAYRFSGNVRELENMLERAVAFSGEKETLEVIDFDFNTFSDTENVGCGLEKHLDKVEGDMIKAAIEKCSGSRQEAADLLQITPRSLRYRMLRLGLDF